MKRVYLEASVPFCLLPQVENPLSKLLEGEEQGLIEMGNRIWDMLAEQEETRGAAQQMLQYIEANERSKLTRLGRTGLSAPGSVGSCGRQVLLSVCCFVLCTVMSVLCGFSALCTRSMPGALGRLLHACCRVPVLCALCPVRSLLVLACHLPKAFWSSVIYG